MYVPDSVKNMIVSMTRGQIQEDEIPEFLNLLFLFGYDNGGGNQTVAGCMTPASALINTPEIIYDSLIQSGVAKLPPETVRKLTVQDIQEMPFNDAGETRIPTKIAAKTDADGNVVDGLVDPEVRRLQLPRYMAQYADYYTYTNIKAAAMGAYLIPDDRLEEGHRLRTGDLPTRGAVMRYFINKNIMSALKYAGLGDGAGIPREVADNILLAVAHPSGGDWLEDDGAKLSDYRALIQQATGIRHVIMVSEALCSVFYLRTLYKDTDLKDLPDNAAMVSIDMGATTTDVAVFVPGQGVPDNMEFSFPLGGRDVDNALRGVILEQCEIHPDSVVNPAIFIWNIRCRKEDYYAVALKEYMERRRQDAMLTEDTFGLWPQLRFEAVNALGERETYTVPFTPSLMRKALCDTPFPAAMPGEFQSLNLSFLHHFARFMHHVVFANINGGLSHGTPIGAVVVTGGTSCIKEIELLTKYIISGEFVCDPLLAQAYAWLKDLRCGAASWREAMNQQAMLCRVYNAQKDYERSVSVGSCQYIRLVLQLAPILTDLHKETEDAVRNALFPVFSQADNEKDTSQRDFILLSMTQDGKRVLKSVYVNPYTDRSRYGLFPSFWGTARELFEKNLQPTYYMGLVRALCIAVYQLFEQCANEWAADKTDRTMNELKNRIVIESRNAAFAEKVQSLIAENMRTASGVLEPKLQKIKEKYVNQLHIAGTQRPVVHVELPQIEQTIIDEALQPIMDMMVACMLRLGLYRSMLKEFVDIFRSNDKIAAQERQKAEKTMAERLSQGKRKKAARRIQKDGYSVMLDILRELKRPLADMLDTKAFDSGYFGIPESMVTLLRQEIARFVFR